MRSSACKYVLDKVSKFEKKYAKPVQKINKREEEDDDFLSSKDNSYLEHPEDKIKINKNNSASCSQVSQGVFRKRLDELDPLENGTIAASDVKSVSNSFKDIRKSNKEDGINVKQRNNCIGNDDENRFENYDYNKKIDTRFSSDSDGSVLAEDLNDNHSFGDINELIAYKHDKDSLICTEDSLEDNLISIEKKIKGNGLETPIKIDIQEENVKKSSLHVNLNLKLYEDPDEISDTSSKGIASLSLKNSISSQNVPLHVFTFEDLIGAEELKSVSEELKGSIEEKCQVNVQTPRTVDNSLIIADDLHLNSKYDGDFHETSLNSSADLEEIGGNVGESSIEEDIEEVIESSDKKNNESIEQIRSSSENVMLSPETEACEVLVSGNRSDIPLQIIESDVIEQEVEDNDKQLLKYNSKEFYEIKNRSEHDLMSTLDKHNRLRKKDGKQFKYAKKSCKREKYLENEWKLLQKSKNVLENELRNVSTQTEKYLAETYDFEKRMETIMKTSFNSMNEVNYLSPEVNNVLPEQTSHSALSPLERGFHCALKQQVELTRHFVHAEYNMYAVCMAAIKEMSSTYKPATLHHNKKMNSNPSSKKAQR